MMIKNDGGANQIVTGKLLGSAAKKCLSQANFKKNRHEKKDTEASKVKATVLENFKFTLVAIKDTEDLEKFYDQFLN